MAASTDGGAAVLEWLASLHAAHFAPLFRDHELSTVKDCVLCIEREEDLVRPLGITRMKTRRDVWQEVARLRRLRGISGPDCGATGTATATDLEMPLQEFLRQLGMAHYFAKITDQGHATTRAVLAAVVAESDVEGKLGIRSFRAQRTLWRAIALLEPYRHAAPAKGAATDTGRAPPPVTAVFIPAQDHEKREGAVEGKSLCAAALKLLDSKRYILDAQGADGLTASGLVQLLRDVADCVIDSSSAVPTAKNVDAVVGNRNFANLARKLLTAAKTLSLSQACTVLYSCGSMPPTCIDGTDPTAAAATTLRQVLEATCVHMTGELQLSRAMQSAMVASAAAAAAGDDVGAHSCAPVATMACNILWTLGKLQRCKPAITHTQLAKDCVAALQLTSGGGVPGEGKAVSVTGAPWLSALRQLCGYSTNAGKFICMAVHGASDLKGIDLVGLLGSVEALRTDMVASTANGEHGADNSSRKRRRSSAAAALPVLQLTAKESRLLQDAKTRASARAKR